MHTTKTMGLFRSIIAFVCLSYATITQATIDELWDLKQIPLNLLTVEEPPNVFVTMDDSCSMWVEHVIPHGEVSDTGQYTHSELFIRTVERTNGSTDRNQLSFPSEYFNAFGFGDGTRMIHMHTHLVQHHRWEKIDWRRLSPNVFELYYNPTITYEPWPGYPNANFNAVHYFAHPDTPGHNKTFDLGSQYGFKFYIHRDTKDKAQVGTKDLDHRSGKTQVLPIWEARTKATPEPPINESNPVVLKDVDTVDLWDDFIEYRISNTGFHTREVTFDVPPRNRGPGDPNPNQYDCVINVSHNTWPSYSDCLGARVVSTQTPSVIFGRTLAQEKQNIANWFQYHRHHLVRIKGGLAEAINARPNLNWGGMLMVDNGQYLEHDWRGVVQGGNQKIFEPIPVPNLDRTGQAIHVRERLLAAKHADFCVTPTMNATQTVGEYFRDSINYQKRNGAGWRTVSTTSPIVSACQQNFHLLLTDGVWTTVINYDETGDFNNDGYADTFSDVAEYYYDTDLSPLDNLVPTSSFNSNTHQHLSQFIVGAGFTIPFNNLDEDGWPDENLETFDWWQGEDPNDPDSFRAFDARVRDHWRAAYESRGAIVSANDADQAIEGALDRIDAQALSRYFGTSAVGARDEGRVITLRFNADDFESALSVQTLDANGTISEEETNKQLLVDHHSSRVVYSSKRSGAGTYTGIPFKHGTGGLTTAQRMNIKPAYVPTSEYLSYTKDLINYVRGDQSEEGDSSTRQWRARSSSNGSAGHVAIGATSHSNLIYVGPPPNAYRSGWAGQPEDNHPYNEHAQTHKDREPMIYFGANDGMLHGIELDYTANQSIERMAYIPDAILGNLHKLTQPDPFINSAFVDGLITQREYYTGSGWRTLLVSGLRTGGQGYFALDITEPSNFTSGNANNVAKWEFTDQDDPDLGYTAGQPVIARLNHGKWGVIFGNGLNNTDPGSGTQTSASGNAVVYILDADSGDLVKKFDTGVGASADPSGKNRPNGILEVGVVNTFVKGPTPNYTGDYIYAGDLFGNLWKIDISHPNPNQWKIALGGNPLISLPAYNDPSPLIPPEPRSITSAPAVKAFDTRDPSKGWLIYVGTGRYLVSEDAQQAYYGPNYFLAVLDANDETVTLSDLVKQTTNTSRTGTVGDFDLRFTTNNPVEYFDASGNAEKKGWYFALDASQGERVTTRPVLDSQTVVFSTLVPSEEDCYADGSSYLMRLDALTGRPTDAAFFDLDADGELSEADMNPLNLSDALTAPSGIRRKLDNAGHHSLFVDYSGGNQQILTSNKDGNVTSVRSFRNPDLDGQQSLIKL